jgi:predicted  nucleic acid-binding Zn-ribbon protein
MFAVVIGARPRASKFMVTTDAKIARLQQDLDSTIKTAQALRKKLQRVTDERDALSDANKGLQAQVNSLTGEVCWVNASLANDSNGGYGSCTS